MWNAGMQLAFKLGADYITAGNSDLVFSPGYDNGLVDALTRTHLVGPVTNASGWGTKRQNVVYWLEDYVLDDSDESIAETAKRLAHFKPEWLEPASLETHINAGLSFNIPETLNGFCFTAMTDLWKINRWSNEHVFNPNYKMELNEVEFQIRLMASGRRAALVPSSFVFHYRALTRGDEYRCEGAFRRK